MKNCGGNKYEAFWKWVPKGSQCKCGNRVDNWQCLNCDYCNPKGTSANVEIDKTTGNAAVEDTMQKE
jgi:hypothetical protein